MSDFRLVYYYLDLAIRRPLVWIVPALIALALGAVYIVNIPRSYYSEAVIVVSSQAIPSTLVQSTVTNERLQFIEQRVLARENLLKLVRKFDLLPELKGQVSNTQLAHIVRGHIVITMRATEASEQFAASSVFGIGVNASTPDLAADMASEIAAMITEENRRARMSRATEASTFLEREVSVLTSRANELGARLSQFTQDNENRLPSRLTLHLSDIREGQSELAEIARELAEARSNLDVLRAELFVHETSGDASLRERRDELRTLRADLVARSTVLSPQHHEIRSIKSRIAALESNLAQAAPEDGQEVVSVNMSPEVMLVGQRIKFAEQQVEALEAQQVALTGNLEEIRNIVADMPNVEAQLNLLVAERDAVQRNLDDMSGKLNVARLGERLETDQQDEQIRILETPEAPLYPSGTSRTNYMLAMLGASLALGMGCLYVADTFDPKIRGAFDVEPVIGESPLVIIDYWQTSAQKRRNIALAAIALLLLALVGGSALLGLYGWPPNLMASNDSPNLFAIADMSRTDPWKA
ncbi:hypothetical protein GTW25_14885 [Aliihoeflea aestuarii]|uniref:GumC family protein n=1 Tax=Aliihoeflea aestuarii TaxID=453840 RepID=UPI00209631B2|nr:hypothetical protein [Aliihoeflea aestuarii]MCO6392315.1 hypothetical protein [Aliihoeflea aestuarii]